MIKTVIRTNNNMVFVFNEKGLQIQEYQGEYNDVRLIITTKTQEKTQFVHWFGISQKPEIVTLNDW